ARTYRDDPRRIDIGHNPDVDEPSLQHSTANCTAKPKNDPKNKDERRLQGYFHCRSQKIRSQDTPSSSALWPARPAAVALLRGGWGAYCALNRISWACQLGGSNSSTQIADMALSRPMTVARMSLSMSTTSKPQA